MILKPYLSIPIRECAEPLVFIPADSFGFFDPPPYMALGAPYGEASPWMLRQGVLTALIHAQTFLQHQRKGWKILIFDAYRPNAVQKYMVEREFGIKAREAGLDLTAITPAEKAQLAEKVFRYWAMPSDDPLTPPPHSTGAALDITLMDDMGREVDMGSVIDEGAPPAAPDYFAGSTDEKGLQAHANRMVLSEAMQAAGFHQNPNEWWHFSRGDQFWTWLERHKNPTSAAIAIYGRADVV